MRDFHVIAAGLKSPAFSQGFGIGVKNRIPWRIPKDVLFFKDITSRSSPGKRNAVIMGRLTWDSIPPRFRPLKDRLNVVLTRNVDQFRADIEQHEDTKVMGSLDEALTNLGADIDSVFVIGGGMVYQEALGHPNCASVYLTELTSAEHIPCDAFFPLVDDKVFELASTTKEYSEKNIRFRFNHYERIQKSEAGFTEEDLGEVPYIDPSQLPGNAEEQQYLSMIADIIENGVRRGDRTGVGTLAKFGCTMRFSLRDDVFPLLTTKRVFWRGVAEELLWFIDGDTNGKNLSEKNVHIWDGNGSREFLDGRGLKDREEGDLGPVYGFQWRHFGAEYDTMHTDYSGRGYDQLMECIRLIKEQPTSRRIVMTAWNPAALHEMALPPCHMFCQFFVADGELSCQMYQRSCDMGLGVPFNIASYALLTRLMAQVCGLKAGEFVHVLGDAHVYLNHVEPLKTQLQREPRAFPKLHITPDITDITQFKYSDFTIEGYRPHKSIKMQMAV